MMWVEIFWLCSNCQMECFPKPFLPKKETTEVDWKVILTVPFYWLPVEPVGFKSLAFSIDARGDAKCVSLSRCGVSLNSCWSQLRVKWNHLSWLDQLHTKRSHHPGIEGPGPSSCEATVLESADSPNSWEKKKSGLSVCPSSGCSG